MLDMQPRRKNEEGYLVHNGEAEQLLLDNLPGLALYQLPNVVPHQAENHLLAQPVERTKTMQAYVY